MHARLAPAGLVAGWRCCFAPALGLAAAVHEGTHRARARMMTQDHPFRRSSLLLVRAHFLRLFEDRNQEGSLWLKRRSRDDPRSGSPRACCAGGAARVGVGEEMLRGNMHARAPAAR